METVFGCNSLLKMKRREEKITPFFFIWAWSEPSFGKPDWTDQRLAGELENTDEILYCLKS